MTNKPMTESAFAGKVEWEGGIFEALDYGHASLDGLRGPFTGLLGPFGLNSEEANNA